MSLKLGTLQRVAQKAVDEASAHDALREEIKRVLGPAVITEGPIALVAERANEHLDVLNGMGKQLTNEFKTSLLLKFAEHMSPEARKLAARMLPNKFIGRMAGDKNRSVRLAVARRLPLNALKEMLKNFPGDDELRLIARSKRLQEDGIAKPKVVDEPFDMYGEERLGDTVKQQQVPELSDQWYDETAHKFIQDYGQNIEGQWEAPVAHRFCSSTKATSGVEVDEAKLLKSIQKQLKEKDDRALKRNELKEIAKRLREEADSELLTESNIHMIGEETDAVTELVESGLMSTEYIEKMNVIFNVKEADMPRQLRKYRLGEGNSRNVMIPTIGRLPHSHGFRSIDEKALDRYVECWTSKQALAGEPLMLSWDPHPGEIGKVSFSVMLK